LKALPASEASVLKSGAFVPSGNAANAGTAMSAVATAVINERRMNRFSCYAGIAPAQPTFPPSSDKAAVSASSAVCGIVPG
jgi:hypothetical protein